MKLSYAVTVCNEINEIERLLPFLVEHKREQDEVVVLFDSTNGSKSVEEYLRSKSVNQVGFRWHSTKFEGNFSDLKNTLTGMCAGDYVFQIDADEMPTEYMMKLIPQIIEANPVDLIRVPRINTVDGLTENHIKMWHWSVNENGWVNYPDYQFRLCKNIPDIKWQNKVHEVLVGYKSLAPLPADDNTFALGHHKTIEKQEKQNNYYNTL